MIGLKIHRNPSLTRSSLVAGLPDMGNVAGIGLSHLVGKTEATLLAEIYSYWPPYVEHKKSVVQYNQYTYKFNCNDKSNLILFSGEFQPQDPRRLYEICQDVVDLAQKFGVVRIFTIGAAYFASVVTEPRIFYGATKAEMSPFLEAAGAQPLPSDGYITGFNGLLLGLAMERGMEGVCLLGEIDNPEIRQPRTAGRIVKMLANLLQLGEIDVMELEEEAKKIQSYSVAQEEYNRVFGAERYKHPPGVM